MHQILLGKKVSLEKNNFQILCDHIQLIYFHQSFWRPMLVKLSPKLQTVVSLRGKCCGSGSLKLLLKYLLKGV